LNELHLFAGAGGGILGGMLLGHTTVCAVEIEEYPRKVLLQRQRDGILPRFPIWDDVQTFDGKPWRGKVDVVCGGFPCQDISAAGKGAGIDGERSGMWREMARIINEIRPKHVFVENSPLLVGRGLARVLGDLTEMGYDSKWCVLGAHHVGGKHKRERIWILANSDEQPQNGRLHGSSWWEREPKEAVCDARQGRGEEAWLSVAECELGRVADGVASVVDRLTALGNGQVPLVAANAFKLLSQVELTGYEKLD